MIIVKLRTRIIIGLLITIGAGFYYLTSWIVNDLRPHYLKSMEESLVDIATLLSSLVAQDMVLDSNITDNLRVAFNDAYKRTFKAKIYDHVKQKMNIRVYITDTKGIVLFDSHDRSNEGQDYSQWNDVFLTLKGKYGARSTRTHEEDPTTSILYVASPILVENEIMGVLSVGKPARSINLYVVQAKNKIIFAGVIASMAVIILSIFLSTWVTWPIRKLTEYARSISDGRPSKLPRLGTFNQFGHSEIGIMGNALDEMREALEGKKYIEKYVQTLTHEIKSPLAAIRGASELIEEDMPKDSLVRFAQNIRTESNRIQSFIDRLLELSALENRRELRNIETVDLMQVGRSILTSAGPQLTSKNLTLVFDADKEVKVQGEKFLIRQAISNLLQNAIDFTPRQGQITLSIHQGEGYAKIGVEDNGVGIPDYARDKIFERFCSLNRPDTKRKSTGLGLSMVKEVAILHGGTISLTKGSPKGTLALLQLPYSV